MLLADLFIAKIRWFISICVIIEITLNWNVYPNCWGSVAILSYVSRFITDSDELWKFGWCRVQFFVILHLWCFDHAKSHGFWAKPTIKPPCLMVTSSPIFDPQVMTTLAARFAAPWGHHDPKRLRKDLVEVPFLRAWICIPWARGLRMSTIHWYNPYIYNTICLYLDILYIYIVYIHYIIYIFI